MTRYSREYFLFNSNPVQFKPSSSKVCHLIRRHYIDTGLDLPPLCCTRSCSHLQLPVWCCTFSSDRPKKIGKKNMPSHCNRLMTNTIHGAFWARDKQRQLWIPFHAVFPNWNGPRVPLCKAIGSELSQAISKWENDTEGNAWFPSPVTLPVRMGTQILKRRKQRKLHSQNSCVPEPSHNLEQKTLCGLLCM